MARRNKRKRSGGWRQAARRSSNHWKRDRAAASAAGKKGAANRWAKVRSLRPAKTPYPGTICDALDAAGMSGPSWAAWRAVAKALHALPLTKPELALFQRQTGRKQPPTAPVTEAWLIVGRRGGKSRFDALSALFAGIRRDYRAVLALGERATVPVIAADKKQARNVLRYLRGLCALPAFAPYVVRMLKDSIELTTGATVEVHTASYRTIRGYTLAAIVCDELAFWQSDDSTNPDVEIIEALRPGMATVPDALLLGSSTPYARRGVLYEAWERHYGRDGDVLVWVADARTMNPTLSAQVVARAFEADPLAAMSEFGRDGAVQFRSDVAAFVDRDAVRAVTVPERRELPRVAGVRYHAFVDPSGGSQDAFTLAIAHRSREGRGVLDLVREVRPPFNPDAIAAEFAATCKTFGLARVTGDRYGGGWPPERFATHGIRYEPSARTKSELYGALLPLINAGRVELLDLPRLLQQLLSLERRTARSGQDSIDHPRGGHDDLCNAAAGALVLAAGTPVQAWRWGHFPR
jgi:hypothetical protein